MERHHQVDHGLILFGVGGVPGSVCLGQPLVRIFGVSVSCFRLCGVSERDLGDPALALFDDGELVG